MSGLARGEDPRPAGPFAAIVGRELGRDRRVVPRLPAMFEEPPGGDVAPDPSSLVPADPRRPEASADRTVPPAASKSRPVPTAPVVADGSSGRERQEGVEVEGRSPLPARPRAPDAPDPADPPARRPRTDRPATTSDGAARVRTRSTTAAEPSDTASGPTPTRALVTSVRPAVAEPATRERRAVSGPEDAGARPVPVVVTRREVREARRADAWAAPTPAPEPVVHVSIGRLEVRAVPPPTPPPRAPRRAERRTQTLDDYLERRNRRSGP